MTAIKLSNKKTEVLIFFRAMYIRGEMKKSHTTPTPRINLALDHWIPLIKKFSFIKQLCLY